MRELAVFGEGLLLRFHGLVAEGTCLFVHCVVTAIFPQPPPEFLGQWNGSLKHLGIESTRNLKHWQRRRYEIHCGARLIRQLVIGRFEVMFD